MPTESAKINKDDYGNYGNYGNYMQSISPVGCLQLLLFPLLLALLLEFQGYFSKFFLLPLRRGQISVRSANNCEYNYKKKITIWYCLNICQILLAL